MDTTIPTGLLFRAVHRFTFNPIMVPSVRWSTHEEERYIVAPTTKDAKQRMKDFIIANPEHFSFHGKTTRKFTHEELQEYFKNALDNEPMPNEPPRLNQHRIDVRFIGDVLL